jgi:signal transduction histidine kinase
MARLVGDLLLLAQSDARQTVRLVPLALEEVVREVYEQALMLAEGPSVRASCEAHAPVLGDADRLKQLLWNLVENAVRHTPEEGRVDLDLSVTDEEAVVRIADTGVGIAAEHLPRIFERFYKVDRARTRGKSGTGLGLAIARYLAEAHNGRLDLESTPGVGTVATLRLPLIEHGAAG